VKLNSGNSLALIVSAAFVVSSCKSRSSQQTNSSEKGFKNPFDNRSVVEKLTEPCPTGEIKNGNVVECKVTNEDALIQESAKIAVESVLNRYSKDVKKSETTATSPAPIFKRDVHPKHHGCLSGQFQVSSSIAPEYQSGIFAEPGKKFKIWSRISNSGLTAAESDESGDLRGITFKLIDVPGKKLLPGQEDSKNLDFLFVNAPFFVAKDISEYNAQLRFKENPANPKNILDAALKTKVLAITAKALASSKMKNPLGETYFSITSFKLGNESVRYRAVPCENKSQLTTEGKTGENKFREAMSATLKRENGCFNFEVRRLLIPSWQLTMKRQRVRFLANGLPWHKLTSQCKASNLLNSRNFVRTPPSMFGEQLKI
jgi:Catalase